MQKFNRILLKLSGEGLANNSSGLLDVHKLNLLTQEIQCLLDNNIELAIVVGGGNICRGTEDNICKEFDRVTIDNMGILATVINGLALSDSLRKQNIPNVVVSALEINKLTEFYNVERTNNFLKQKKVVILVGGISNPFFSTDTASVLRAAELNCCAVLKATQVHGIYDKDPKKYKDAVKINKITYDEVIKQQLLVMDLQSVIIAKTVNMPIYIFNMHEVCAIRNLIKDKLEYSIIC